MASPRSSNPQSSAKAYKANPGSYAKKLAYDKKYNAQPENKAKRVELGKARRKAKRLGFVLSGKDMSHTRDGGIVPECSSANRARNGHGGNGRLK